MIIECFALTEVGKSTIIKDLEERYGIKSIPEQNVSLIRAVLFILAHPVSMFRLIFLFLKEGFSSNVPWKITRFKLAVLKSTISRLHFASNEFDDNDLVLIDEGLVQRLFSLYETKQPVSTYVELLNKIPLSDSILFLEYKGESDRIKNGRVGTMRRSINDDYTEEWRSTMLHNYHSLRDALALLGLIDVGYSRDDNKWFDLDLVMKDLELRLAKHLKN